LYQERYFRAVMPLTDAVVCVSAASRRFLVEQRGLPERKSKVILNGIRLERFLATPARPGSLLPRIRFGAVGRLVPVKGHAFLVDAFASLIARLPAAELRIVGGGPLESALSAQIQNLGLGGRVRLEGFHTNIHEVFQEFDIFVFPSTSEGLPLVILEAMTAGLPIVSTRVGGVPEVAPEGQIAWYCPPGDVPALADAMYAAAVCGDLAGKGEMARRIAAEKFGVEEMTRQYEAVYQEAFRKRRSSTAAAAGVTSR
jgi:glycosyltransferase involved in cell wall biosynthesis